MNYVKVNTLAEEHTPKFRGMLTTRYTHKCSGFEVFKFGLPVNHSGQKVIHLV
jgi:hypothetical protein